jgi:uncharacterized membrane protein
MRKAAVGLAVAFLAYEGLSYYLSTVEHFEFDVSEANFGRLWPNRFWLFLHFTGGTAALFTGPLQLWSGVRDRHREIHRWIGRVYVAGVFLAGGSAFYLSVFTRPRSFGVALFVLAVAWWFTVSRAFWAVKHHRITSHQVWMMRGYALTMSFVSFRVLNELPLWTFAGEARLAVVLWVSWVLPLALTELLLLRRAADRRRLMSS